MITHIFFDLDNTFYDYEIANKHATESVLSFMSSYTGIEIDELNIFFSRSRKEVKDQLGSIASSHSRLLYFKKMNELIFHKTDIDLSLKLNNIFWTVYFRNMTIFPSAKKLLTKAKDLNIKTIVATNLTTDIQLRKIVELGINELIDYVVTSEDAGIEKPHPDYVRYLKDTAQYNDNIHSSWFVGDDLHADIKAGINLNSEIFIRSSKNKTSKNNDYITFSSFIELCKRLEDLTLKNS